ncbi:MAG: hypothetical protein DLM61_18840 [Pseudonocardiales bacterium]|nr:MAG: hypothetical protein DLM61_18840 [Pseudonocardiales bacterium]
MALRWFVDESALGLGKLLASTRDDVIYAGHPNLPEIPLGTSDVGWMPIVAERNWVAIRRDRRIHTRPREVRVFSEVGLRTVWLGGKKDMGSRQQLDLVNRHWQTPLGRSWTTRTSGDTTSRSAVTRAAWRTSMRPGGTTDRMTSRPGGVLTGSCSWPSATIHSAVSGSSARCGRRFRRVGSADSSPAGQRLHHRWREIGEPVVAEPREYNQGP